MSSQKSPLYINVWIRWPLLCEERQQQQQQQKSAQHWTSAETKINPTHRFVAMLMKNAKLRVSRDIFMVISSFLYPIFSLFSMRFACIYCTSSHRFRSQLKKKPLLKPVMHVCIASFCTTAFAICIASEEWLFFLYCVACVSSRLAAMLLHHHIPDVMYFVCITFRGF